MTTDARIRTVRESVSPGIKYLESVCEFPASRGESTRGGGKQGVMINARRRGL